MRLSSKGVCGQMGDLAYEVVWPLGRPTPASLGAQRLTEPAGKTVGFVWDYAFRGDLMWDVIKVELSKRYPDMRFVDWEVFGNTHGHDENEVVAALPGMFRQAG